MRAIALALLVAIGCQDEEGSPLSDSGIVDTGMEDLAPRALGGQAPGVANTAEQPLSTFPLDGSLPYTGSLPEVPAGDRRFALETSLSGNEQTWRLDVGLAAGLGAAKVRDVGVRLAFNPQAVRRYRLDGAVGTGQGIEIQRVPELIPGSRVGASFDLWPTSPTDRAGQPRPYRSFLGTVTVSWTEDGEAREHVVKLERN